MKSIIQEIKKYWIYILIVLILLPIILYIYKFGSLILSNKHNHWAEFGTYLGGIYTPILSILTIILLAFQFQWIAVLALVATRYTIAWITIGFSAGKLKENDIKIWFPIVEILLIFTQINIFITNLFSKPVHWK